MPVDVEENRRDAGHLGRYEAGDDEQETPAVGVDEEGLLEGRFWSEFLGNFALKRGDVDDDSQHHEQAWEGREGGLL